MCDLHVARVGHVEIVEICRAPDNFFDRSLIEQIATAFEGSDNDPDVRAIVLCAEGRNFCAGARFATGHDNIAATLEPLQLYRHAVRLFRCQTPIVVSVQGAAVGGGLGLALVGDFRVASPESRFSANFNRLGFHPGFGLSVTLPRLAGPQHAALMLYTGRRLGGEEAYAFGLVDMLVPQAELRASALALAQEIAQSAPLAVASTRRTLRGDLADQVAVAVEHELAEQQRHFATADFKEGVAAMTERRPPRFAGI